MSMSRIYPYSEQEFSLQAKRNSWYEFALENEQDRGRTALAKCAAFFGNEIERVQAFMFPEGAD